METRPVLVGLDNPQGDDPELALYPWPEGCAGHRLWQMLCEVEPRMPDWKYLRSFERRNLGGHPVSKSAPDKRALWRAMEYELRGRRVVLLGAEVRDAAGLGTDAPIMVFSPSATRRTELAWVPHPSGRNRFYNRPANRLAVGKFLYSLIRTA